MSKNDKDIEAKDITADVQSAAAQADTKAETTPGDITAGEDHIAVDDVDAAKMLRESIVRNVKEEEQPLSAGVSLRKILGGDILNAQFIRRQVWLMLLIVLFMMVYIANRYSCQKDLVEIDRLNEQLKDAKYKALSSNSAVTEKCRESNVLEMLRQGADSTLHVPTQPPFIINVPEK